MRLTLALSLIVAAFVAGQEDLRDITANCNRSTDECLATLVERLRPYMREGLPEYDIPVTEPMSVDRIDFRLQQGTNIDVQANFTNSLIHGLAEFELQSIHADKTSDPRTLSMTIFSRQLVAEGSYRLKGQALVKLDLSSGTYKSIFTDVTFAGVSRIKRNNNGQLTIDGTPDLKLTLGNMTIKFDNLFDGKTPQLSDLIHNFVNDDPQTFFNDFRPEIEKQVSVLLGGIFKSAVANVSPQVFNL